jgi:hypothetical protein
LGTLGGGGAPVITLATHVPEFVSHSDGLMHGGLQSMHILGGRAAGPSCCAVGFNSVHSNDTIVSIVDAMPRGLVRLRFDTSTPLRIVVSAIVLLIHGLRVSLYLESYLSTLGCFHRSFRVYVTRIFPPLSSKGFSNSL